jgi:hypothetical protein
VFPVGDEAVGVGDDRATEPAVLAHPVTQQAELLVGHLVGVVAVGVQVVDGDSALELGPGQVVKCYVVGHTST